MEREGEEEEGGERKKGSGREGREAERRGREIEEGAKHSLYSKPAYLPVAR